MRGFSEGKSEASKRATNFGLAKTSNFFYTVLAVVFHLDSIKINIEISYWCIGKSEL